MQKVVKYQNNAKYIYIYIYIERSCLCFVRVFLGISCLKLGILALDLDSVSLALETISLIVRASSKRLALIGGWTSLPLSAPTETSVS